MVFSSIPAYLDPSNWQQQPQHHHHQQNQGNFHHGISSINPILTNPNPLLPPPPLPPQQPPRAQLPPNMGPMPSSSGSIRPGSMAERARMANIPMPEMALKCPRCESTNTKFCYFNNYSLSQPRHFCKTCRRYWTRGGALRSVPVGGGCRRNKRSKSSSSSKSAASDRSSSAPATSSATSGMSVGGSGPGGHSSVAEMMGLTSSLRFMSPLHHLTDFGDQLGLSNYTGIPTAGESSFHLSGPEQWRIPAPNQTTHFPFLGGLDGAPGSSLYGHPFEGVEFSSLAIGGTGGPLRAKAALEAGGGSGQLADAVKMENGAVRRFNMGIGTNNQGNGEDNYNWGNGSNSSGNAWTDLSALNNSSCSTTSAL